MFSPSWNDFKATTKSTQLLFVFSNNSFSLQSCRGKDNLNLAKLVVLWKFRFTSGADHKQNWVHFHCTGPGLCTTSEQVPSSTTESTVAGRGCRPARHKVAAVSDPVSPKRDILFVPVARYLHSTKQRWKIL